MSANDGHAAITRPAAVGWAIATLAARLTALPATRSAQGSFPPRCPARESASSVVEVLPRRWVVERAFAWISKHRCTVRDYEHRPASHEAMILWAMIALMTRRLAQPTDLSDAHFRSGIP